MPHSMSSDEKVSLPAWSSDVLFVGDIEWGMGVRCWHWMGHGGYASHFERGFERKTRQFYYCKSEFCNIPRFRRLRLGFYNPEMGLKFENFARGRCQNFHFLLIFSYFEEKSSVGLMYMFSTLNFGFIASRTGRWKVGFSKISERWAIKIFQDLPENRVYPPLLAKIQDYRVIVSSVEILGSRRVWFLRLGVIFGYDPEKSL